MMPAEGNQRIGIPAYFTSHAWVEAGFDEAAELDLAELNTSAFQPPMEHCTFRIVEAAVEEEG